MLSQIEICMVQGHDCFLSNITPASLKAVLRHMSAVETKLTLPPVLKKHHAAYLPIVPLLALLLLLSSSSSFIFLPSCSADKSLSF